MPTGVFVDTLPGSKSLDEIIADGLNATLFTTSLAAVNFLTGHTYGAGVFAANEVAAGGGYTTGGLAVTGLARASVGSEILFVADDVNWPASTINARYCLLSDAADDAAVYLIDFGATFSSAASTFPVHLGLGALLGYSP